LTSSLVWAESRYWCNSRKMFKKFGFSLSTNDTFSRTNE
jgi:hypothetical protein